MAAQKFYSISTVCQKLKIPPHTLRYWEKEFEIKFQRNSAGRRIVSAEQLKKLELIRHFLYQEKMTIKGAKRKLAKMSFTKQEPPDTKNRQELLLWLKKQLIELRALLASTDRV